MPEDESCREYLIMLRAMEVAAYLGCRHIVVHGLALPEGTTPEENVELIGHAVGGVCPFAVNDGVKIYLDESLKRFETVFPACGSANSAIELTMEELETYSSFTAWIDICKAWQ